DIDRHPPIGNFAQLLDLYLEVVGTGPVGVAAGAALVDTFRQRAHGGNALGDLLPEQHAAATRLGALADDDLDGIGLSEVIGIHAVAGRQHLVDEGARRTSLFGRHAAVAGGGTGAHLGCRQAQRLLGVGAERPEAHTGNRDRYSQVHRVLREARTQGNTGFAGLAVSLQRVARYRGAEKKKVVETRDSTLGAEPADLVDPLLRGAMDLGQDVLGKGRRGPEMASVDTHYSRLGSILVDVVDIESVQAASRAVAAKIRRVGADPGLVQQRRDLGVVPLSRRRLHAVRTEAGNLAADVQPR